MAEAPIPVFDGGRKRQVANNLRDGGRRARFEADDRKFFCAMLLWNIGAAWGLEGHQRSGQRSEGSGVIPGVFSTPKHGLDNASHAIVSRIRKVRGINETEFGRVVCASLREIRVWVFAVVRP